ncbi:prolyl oligopeptidase family serine peptidase [Paenibacillus thermotolerans]|uniref:carboxylesterase family protein n=1 Tax=Paenibacillus thermotolerans TaxID=3027807 RepID=UPI002367EB24|nr:MULTISPECIES: prolyl oligopeptidase family serine peptidase [unclassified Paenibacillus]
MSQTSHTMVKEIVKTVRSNYLLYLPKQYEESEEKWPLIVFLHGAGERGSDIEKVKIHGIPKIAEGRDDFPFIAVSPQCPEDSFWSVEIDALDSLINEIADNYRVDTDRIYLTGLSMGGYGTWTLSIAYPDRFAAIAPICGGENPARAAATLKNVPIWVFHGAKDNVVPLRESEQMVEALQRVGGNVKFTVYPDADHDSWTETYNNPDLYEWFLKHSLADR